MEADFLSVQKGKPNQYSDYGIETHSDGTFQASRLNKVFELLQTVSTFPPH